MQQYYDIKSKHKDAILFFRMGDFYEMFEEDASIAHKVLGIALTTRNKNAENPIPLAWIPFHAKEKYLSSLVNAGYKVAIAEQVSDPKLKGIVQREVVRVVTPATLQLESESYDEVSKGSVIVSITYSSGLYGLAILDISENSFICSEFPSLERLCEQIYKLNPSEVVLEKTLFSDELLSEVLQKKYALNIYYFSPQQKPLTYLKSFFNVTSLDGFWIETKSECQSSAAQLLEYLQEHQKTNLSFVTSLSYESFSWYMWLDESTIRSLDLVYNISTNSAKVGTLFWVLDKTKTNMGKRYLRDQILHPLQDIAEIRTRQNFVRAFIEDKVLLDTVMKHLASIADVDAILNRISLDRAGIRDMIQLKRSLQAILEIKKAIDSSQNTTLKKIYNS